MIRQKRVLHPFENIDNTYVYMILVRTFLSYIGTSTGLYFTVVKYNHYFIDIFSSLNCNLIFKKIMFITFENPYKICSFCTSDNDKNDETKYEINHYLAFAI